MGLLERCQEFFGTTDLYGILGITKQANDSDIRRSYYKVSLQVHPDRAPGDLQATEKFKALGKLYAVLSDKEQRAIYDEQGTVDEENDILSQNRNWEEYWRLLFPKITLQDIIEFEKTYKGSIEEREDLLKLYAQHEGDMDAITVAALCCTQEDEPRIVGLIQKAIAQGEVPSYAAFVKESDQKKRARHKRAQKEKQEAEEMQREMGLEAEDNLVMMLKQRQKSREQGFNSFLADLEAKYSKPGKSKAAKRK